MPRSRHHRMAACGNTMVAQRLSPYFLSGFVRADEGGGVRVAKHEGSVYIRP
jgi:intracellular sulfur oxidation DsrE/DsrF family protein